MKYIGLFEWKMLRLNLNENKLIHGNWIETNFHWKTQCIHTSKVQHLKSMEQLSVVLAAAYAHALVVYGPFCIYDASYNSQSEQRYAWKWAISSDVKNTAHFLCAFFFQCILFVFVSIFIFSFVRFVLLFIFMQHLYLFMNMFDSVIGCVNTTSKQIKYNNYLSSIKWYRIYVSHRAKLVPQPLRGQRRGEKRNMKPIWKLCRECPIGPRPHMIIKRNRP